MAEALPGNHLSGSSVYPNPQNPLLVAEGRTALNTMFWAGLFVVINGAINDISLTFPIGAVLLFVAISRLDKVFDLGASLQPLYACAALTAAAIAIGYFIPGSMSLTPEDGSGAQTYSGVRHLTNLLGAWVLTKPMLALTEGRGGKASSRWATARWATLAGLTIGVVALLLSAALGDDSSLTLLVQITDVLVALFAGVITLLALRTTRSELHQ